MSLKKPNFKPIKAERVAAALSKSDKKLFEKGSKFLFAKRVSPVERANPNPFPSDSK